MNIVQYKSFARLGLILNSVHIRLLQTESKERLLAPRNKTSQDSILKVASELAEAVGLRGVGVRAIAAQLGISPGTIYNVVGDIDDVILLVNAQTLRRLQTALLAEFSSERDPMSNVFAIADAYIDFVIGNAKSWSMILEHSFASEKLLPNWYLSELNKTIDLVDRALKPVIADKRERRRSVATLWASLQGLASLAASGKLSMVDQDDPHDLARLLISRFFGLAKGREKTNARRETVKATAQKKTRASPAAKVR
jgi:AcrR family transcriptional regulator